MANLVSLSCLAELYIQVFRHIWQFEMRQSLRRLNSNKLPGKVNYAPVHFLYASVELDELTALYAVADVCFVSSLRDGMNLVSYEYVACHAGKALQFLSNDRASGSLVLSQFAGAASHLDGAFLINPLDKQSCADVLAYALNMDAAEVAARMRKMGEKVETQTRYASTLPITVD